MYKLIYVNLLSINRKMFSNLLTKQIYFIRDRTFPVNGINVIIVATLTKLRFRHKLFHLARTSLMNNKTLRAGDLDYNKIFALALANPSP